MIDSLAQRRKSARRVAYFDLISSIFMTILSIIIAILYGVCCDIYNGKGHRLNEAMEDFVLHINKNFKLKSFDKVILMCSIMLTFILCALYARYSYFLLYSTKPEVDIKQALQDCRNWQRLNKAFYFFNVFLPIGFYWIYLSRRQAHSPYPSPVKVFGQGLASLGLRLLLNTYVENYAVELANNHKVNTKNKKKRM